MSKIVELLRRLTGAKLPPTAAEFRAAEADARMALDAAMAAVEKLEGEHRAALLDMGDREVERIEGLLTAQRREVARATAALAELGARAEAAEAREAEAEVDRVLAEAEHSAAMAAATVRARYETLAAELASVLEKAEAADVKVSAARLAAMKAGREVVVRDVSERLAPEGRIFVPFRDAVSLRPAGRFPGWGAAASEFQRMGFTAELAQPE
jgi:hypothetical protein